MRYQPCYGLDVASDTEEDEEVSKPLPGGSMEACVRRFAEAPQIEDPEAFCGWLEANQSNEVVSAWDPEEDSVEDLLEALADPEAEKVLQNLKVTYVSGVENPAQDSQWVMAKDADDRGADWGVTAPLVFKQEEPPMPEEGEESGGEDEKKAWAPVLIPNETDKQGDVIPVGEIEEAAHGFLANYRKIDTDHDLMEGKGVPIESWTLKSDTSFDLPNGEGETREYPVGTWMLGVQFNDEAWDRVKAGELQGFSIYGEAENTPIEEILGLSTEDGGTIERNAGTPVELAKEVRQIAKETNTTMSNEETEDGEGGEETEATLESIKSTVEDNNNLAKETREDVNDLQKSHESLEDRVDTMEEELEAVKSGEETEAGEGGEGGEETEEAGKGEEETPEDAVTEEDLEEAKEALEDELEGKTEEAAEKAAEAAVKSVLGLDEDEDLPEDAEERRDVIRKGLTEPGEDGGTGGSIGFTAEDVGRAVRGGN